MIVVFIYWFSLHSCQNGHVLFVTQYDNNTFPTSPNEIAAMKRSQNGATRTLIEALSAKKPDWTIQEFIDEAVKPSKRNDVAKLLTDFDNDRPDE